MDCHVCLCRVDREYRTECLILSGSERCSAEWLLTPWYSWYNKSFLTNSPASLVSEEGQEERKWQPLHKYNQYSDGWSQIDHFRPLNIALSDGILLMQPLWMNHEFSPSRVNALSVRAVLLNACNYSLKVCFQLPFQTSAALSDRQNGSDRLDGMLIQPGDRHCLLV